MGQILYSKNDSLMRVKGLTDEITGDVVNSATVTVTILDRNKLTVTGPLTMAYVAGSNGDYEGIIPGSTVLTVGQSYRAKVDVVSGSSVAEWFLPVIVQYRES